MVYIIKTFFLIYSLFLFSDSAAQTEIIKISDSDFEEVNLVGKVMGGWINDEVKLPAYVLLDRDLLIVVEEDLQINDQLIKFFSIENREKIGYYGRSGSGPGEVQGGLQVVSTYGLNGQLSFLDYTRNRVSVIEIEDVLAGEHYKEPDRYKVMPPDYMHMQFGAIVNDTLLIGGGSIQEGKLVFANYISNQYRLTDFIPEKNIEISSFLKPNLYLSNLAVNKNKERLVSASRFFNQLEIYNFDGDAEIIIVGDHTDQVFEITNRSWSSDQTIRYYSGITTTDDYIMAIFYNKTNEEMRDEHGYFREGLKSTIRIFDWSGQPVKQLNLDRRIASITYDEINKRIIGIDKDAFETMVEFKVDL